MTEVMGNMRNPHKRFVVLSLLILIILGVGVNISSNIIWGYHTINNPDEYRHFAKARQIAYHNTPLNKMWDDPQHYDLYPAGFHIFIASFMLLTDNYDTFFISILYRILFAVIISLIIFLIGRKINNYVGILSVFFYNTFFFISTYVGRIGAVTYKNPYPHIVSHQSYLAPYLITHLLVFLSLLLYLLFLKSNLKNEIKIGTIILIILVAHGVSHISTFIGFVANFSIFIILITLFLFKNKFFLIKNFKFLLIIILSTTLTYFFYYYPMSYAISTPEYNLSHFLPSLLPPVSVMNFTLVFSLTLVFTIAFIIVITMYWKSKYKNLRNFLRPLVINRFFIFLITPLYILLYLTIILLVTKNPAHYNYSGFQLVNGIFPTYLPKSYDYLVLYSLIISFSMYILSIISIFFSMRSSHSIALYIVLIYLIFYIVWWIFTVPIHYYADRIIYFVYLLPFIYALGVYYFMRKIKIWKTSQKYDKNIKSIIISTLLIFVLLTNIVTQINSDPVIRENMNIQNPLRIGVNNPPTITWSLCVATNIYTHKNEYILTSMQVGEALAGTTHIRPPTLMYNIIVKNHKNWRLRHNAFFGSELYRKEFFEQYNARYLIVGVIDITAGGEIPGQLAPIKKYNSSAHLILIYAKGDGERIYLWVN